MSDSVRPHRWQPTRLPCPWDSPGKNTGVGCHFLLQCMKVKSQSEVAQSCSTLSNPMDCSLPGSSIHGILQARVLEWGAIAFSEFLCYTLLISILSRLFMSILPIWWKYHNIHINRHKVCKWVTLPVPIQRSHNYSWQVATAKVFTRQKLANATDQNFFLTASD